MVWPHSKDAYKVYLTLYIKYTSTSSNIWSSVGSLLELQVWYLSVEKKEPDVLLRKDRSAKRWLWVETISQMRFCFSLASNTGLLHSFYIYWSPSLSFLFCPLLCLLFLSSLLLSYFPHPSSPSPAFLPPGQPFPTMTCMLLRSWDTLRQRWERISVEFNLVLRLNPRQWNPSPMYQWNIALSLQVKGGRVDAAFFLSVNQFLLIHVCFCRLWHWE